MAEENTPNEGIAIPESQQEHAEWQPSEAEERAMSGGWVPKEQWVEDGNDPDAWVNAREFNVRGELMSRITQQGKRLGALEAALQKAQNSIAASDRITQQLITDAVEKTKRNLRAERKSAMEIGDWNTVDTIDSQIEEINAAVADARTPAPQQVTQQGRPDPIAASWAMYVTNTASVQSPEIFKPLLEHAERIRPTVNGDVGEFMRQVMAKADELRGIRARPGGGPDEGKGGNRNKRPPSKNQYSASDLNDQQKFIGQAYVDDGLYESLDEYAKEIGAGGGLNKQRR